jgi:hypothetical protein
VPLWVNDQDSNATNVDKKFDGKVIRLITSVMTPGVHRTTKARRQGIEQQRAHWTAQKQTARYLPKRVEHF